MVLIVQALVRAAIGALIALVFASFVARAADWAWGVVPDSIADPLVGSVAAAFNEQDGAVLTVACFEKDKRLGIAFHEPRAKWQKDASMQAVITSDRGDRLPLNGIVMNPAGIAVGGPMGNYADISAAIVLMGQAETSLSISAGGYTRSFSVSSFHNALVPVLRQCGLAWFGR
jgi:hypothetical protein